MKGEKSVLITGATGKFGNVFVERFIKLGYEVIGISRSEENIQNIKNKLNNPSLFKSIKLDLLHPNAYETLLTNLEELNLYPSILINNARSLENLSLSENGLVSTDSFLNEFNLAVVVAYNLIMQIANQKNSRLESVINISSIYGLVAPNLNLYDNPNSESFPHYGVSKAALIHLTKELAVRLAEKNLKVNCIAYGGFKGRASNEFIERYSKLCPMGEMLNEEDIFNPIKFLAESNTLSINGQTIVVDGGWTLW